MLGEFPRNTWHVSWTPRKYFPVLTEELDERAFLCDRQTRGYIDCLGRVGRVHLMRPCVICCVERSIDCQLFMLRQECAVVGDRQISECLLHAERLGDFAELAVVSIGPLEVSMDSDYSFWSWHLQHEVRVVWHRHESSERWAPKDSMVL